MNSMKAKTEGMFIEAAKSYQNIILGIYVNRELTLTATFPVRHPIERLLSAYRDRVAGLKFSASFYLKVASTLHIRRNDAVLPVKSKQSKQGRRRLKPNGQNITVPTWSEFVDYVLKINPLKDVSRGRLQSF